MLKTRVITGAVLTVLFGLTLMLSGLSWVLPAAGTVLSLMSIYELTRATGFLKSKRDALLTGVWALGVSVLPCPHFPWLTAVCFPVCLGLSGWLMACVGRRSRVPGPAARGLALLIPLFYRAMAELRGLEHGLFLLFISILAGVATDVAAYFTGRYLGSHPLAPRLSPHKTVEGSLGGLLGAVAVPGALTALVFGPGAVRWGRLMAYLITGSLVGQFGDLALSAIKRIAGTKDYSQLLPGHGGILDRFDSALFLLPYSYLFFRILPWLK